MDSDRKIDFVEFKKPDSFKTMDNNEKKEKIDEYFTDDFKKTYFEITEIKKDK